MEIQRPLAALLAGLLLASCATVREAGRTPIAGELGAVRVAVFADDDARGAGRLLGEPIAAVLERREKGRWQPVFRSLEPSWAVAGLEPGSYRVRFDLTLDERGRPEDLERPVRRTVDVRRGEAVDVELVLDHVSPAMVAAGAAAIVVAAVLLHEWLDDHDLPRPPPPPAWAFDAAFWITLDATSRPREWVPQERAPQVTSHFPRAGETVAADRVRVVFVLSEPIDGERLGDDAVAVTSEDGEELPGRVRWDATRWWIVWEPAAPLPPGRRLRASLRPGAVADATGRELAGPTGFDFDTAP
jgi:hypothetical protein